jgi:outer membrane biogenesis lipoprotein LolB
MRKLLLTALAGILLTGCYSSTIQTWEDSHPEKKWKITLYSGSEPIKTWTTKMRYIQHSTYSDVFYFTDDATKKEVAITGTVIAEEL